MPGLTKGNTYQFRVRAVNKAGPGEPGEATAPHIAKARYCKQQEAVAAVIACQGGIC